LTKLCGTTLRLITLLTCFAAAAGAQTDSPHDVVVASVAERLPDIVASLEALDPSDPTAYVELGEWVVSEARGEAEYRLAQRLYVLGATLSRATGGRDTLAASACVALADISRSEPDRRALWSLAGSLDARYAMRDWSRTADPNVSDDVAFAAANALGNIRSGNGHLAREVLKRPEVQSLLRAFSVLLMGAPNQDPLAQLEREAAAWPCPECRNERVVTRRVSGVVSTVLCNTCQGNPGPTADLSSERVLAQLRFEARVLNGVQRSWGAQIEMDQGAPFRDVDLETLATRYGVDTQRPLFRNGDWQAVDPVPDPATSSPAPPHDADPKP
jgi:hypothetical protein